MLALLALGLNLIFGVIDVVWMPVHDLVMCGISSWLYAVFGWPLFLACAAAIVGVAVLGVLVHVLIIAPILGSAPINQLLATGGLLFFLQSFATLPAAPASATSPAFACRSSSSARFISARRACWRSP